MKIGVGIDTGGTCTDGVVYDLDNKTILASAKTPTTREDLSLGIDSVLDMLPEDLLRQAQIIGLSTTLATNACVENKGGRSKLIFIGMEKEAVERTGQSFGLPLDDTLFYIPCKKTLRGEITEEPDWQEVEARLIEALKDCQAVGIVELYAAGSGAAMEKKVRDMVEKLGIPVVCGYEISQEMNVIGRGASVLLNARLISVIAEFLQAVKQSLQRRGLTAPVVIVRSDGSMMNEDMTQLRPIETILSGPAASVMGAAELHRVIDGVMIDMGGTTTDISLIRDGIPIRADKGISVGNWNIFVKGLYVDTFGLGGDTEVLIQSEKEPLLGDRRVMPLCMAASRYPRLLKILQEEKTQGKKYNSWRKNIYVGLKDISGKDSYTDFERQIAGFFYENPMTLIELEARHHISLIPDSLERLINEGVLIRCGVTPTDAMHVLGDYRGYCVQAAEDGLEIMAALLTGNGPELTSAGLAEKIYDLVKKKLYCNIARILLWDRYPAMRKEGMTAGMSQLTEALYEQAYRRQTCTGNCKTTAGAEMFELNLTCDVPLLGVGGPIGVFLKDVAAMLGTKALLGPHTQVANALGAIAGNVEVCITMEIQPDPDTNMFRISGGGESLAAETLEEAEELAETAARRLALEEALRRGAVADKLVFRREDQLQEATSSYGTSLFISKQVTVISTHLAI